MRTYASDLIAHACASQIFGTKCHNLISDLMAVGAIVFLITVAFLMAVENNRLSTKLLVGLKRVSYSGARAVLEAFGDEAFGDEFTTRNFQKRLKRAKDEILDEDVKMKMELPLDDGTTFTWILARPQALLRELINASIALQSVLRPLLKENSYGNPLSMIHYHDEITSGALLSPVHSRSFTTFRFTFKQFGKYLLTCQQMWFEFAVLRSSVVKKVVGGLSYVWRRLQHQFFTSTESFSKVGMHIDNVGDGPTVLFARNKNLIADMEATQDTLDLKGSSGLRNCIKCANCMKKGVLKDTAYPLPNPDGQLADVTSPTLEAFVPNTNEAIFENVDELQRLKALVQAKRMLKGNFQLAEMACGINHNPHGLLLDKELRAECPPLDMHTEDWAHVYLASGVGADELGLFLGRLKAIRVNYETFREEMKLWNWPAHSTNFKNAWQLFSDARQKANEGGWKSSISEFLSIYPIVLDWVSRNAKDDLPGEVESFGKLCAVLDYIQEIKHGNASDTGKLHALIEEHMHAHKNVYGNEHWTPKWHATLHLAGQIERDDGYVFDTILNERAYHTAKCFGDIAKRLSCFEEYVLARSVANQIDELRKFNPFPSLEGETKWDSKLHAFTAGKMSLEGLHITRGDYVLTREGEVAQVQLCGLTDDGNLFLLGDVCHATERTATSVVVERRHELLLIWVRDHHDVTCARCWKRGPGSEVLRVII